MKCTPAEQQHKLSCHHASAQDCVVISKVVKCKPINAELGTSHLMEPIGLVVRTGNFEMTDVCQHLTLQPTKMAAAKRKSTEGAGGTQVVESEVFRCWQLDYGDRGTRLSVVKEKE